MLSQKIKDLNEIMKKWNVNVKWKNLCKICIKWKNLI